MRLAAAIFCALFFYPPFFCPVFFYPLLGGAEWVRIEGPGIELYANTDARALMQRFAQVRATFNDGPTRLRVFVFASADEFHRYRADSDGFFERAPKQDYIAMYAGADATRIAVHEYVHRVLRHSAAALPKWFDEGTSEFYSTLRVEKDRVRIGDAIPAHLDLLSREKWLDAAALAAGAPRSDDRGLFYAESWALAHMLNLAPGWREGLPRFFSLLAQDRAADEAFHEAFGRTIHDALKDLRGYLKQMRSTTIAATVSQPEPARVERISDEQAALARAELALAVSRTELAAELTAKLADSAEVESTRGAIALAANRREEARRHFDRAIEMGSRDAFVYFEYAMMERESDRPDQEMLRKTVAIDQDFADAHFLLGVRATDDGAFPEALEHLRAAVRVRPDRSNYWHALGYAQAKAGDFEGAAASARRARATAESEQEMKMAEALAGLRREGRPIPARAAVVTPPSWKRRKGDARIEGTLIEFDCTGPRIRVRDSRGSILVLRVDHPSEIELVNTPDASFLFACGAQNRHVSVEYDSASQDVTQIEFRL
jgi:tetratricopeptide (TPR) repeat protein